MKTRAHLPAAVRPERPRVRDHLVVDGVDEWHLAATSLARCMEAAYSLLKMRWHLVVDGADEAHRVAGDAPGRLVHELRRSGRHGRAAEGQGGGR